MYNYLQVLTLANENRCIYPLFENLKVYIPGCNKNIESKHNRIRFKLLQILLCNMYFETAVALLKFFLLSEMLIRANFV